MSSFVVSVSQKELGLEKSEIDMGRGRESSTFWSDGLVWEYRLLLLVPETLLADDAIGDKKVLCRALGLFSRSVQGTNAADGYPEQHSLSEHKVIEMIIVPERSALFCAR